MQHAVPTYWNVETQQDRPGRWWEELQEQQVQERAGGGGRGEQLPQPRWLRDRPRGSLPVVLRAAPGGVVCWRRAWRPSPGRLAVWPPLCVPAPWVNSLEPPCGHMQGLLSQHRSSQFSILGPHSCSLNWLQSTTRSPKHGNMWSQGHISEAGWGRVGAFMGNIYDFCLGSCFLNSWTAIQITHDFNGIFGFNNGW